MLVGIDLPRSEGDLLQVMDKGLQSPRITEGFAVIRQSSSLDVCLFSISRWCFDDDLHRPMISFLEYDVDTVALRCRFDERKPRVTDTYEVVTMEGSR